MLYEEFLKTPEIQKFESRYKSLISIAKGSNKNHQAWEGGYMDHILQCLAIAERMYLNLSELSPLVFSLESVFRVLYFHDAEKIWKYSEGIVIDKPYFYNKALPEEFGIKFTEEELAALTYIHGEDKVYSGNERAMNELCAFCHCVDVISARIFCNKKFNDLNWKK